MATRKPFTDRRKLALDEFRQQVLEAQSQLASITLVADNAEEFEVPHPMLIGDDAQRRLEIVQTGQDLDRDEDGEIKKPFTIDGKRPEPLAIRTALALLGKEEHARFIAAGGNSNDITLAWQYLTDEHQDRAEADPK